jgi:hypothetical protein
VVVKPGVTPVIVATTLFVLSVMTERERVLGWQFRLVVHKTY